ncbi:MAG: homoserine dehydrogenase [Pseudomonadales bacterium]|nr:homoserine dehydrogenase [Pseudomonadales bacterium]
MKQVRLGIAGLGTVAQGVLSIIATNGDKIRARSGVELKVTRVASRTLRPEVDLLGADFSQDLSDLIADDVDIVLELIGGEEVAKNLIETALDADKPVVTANKAVIASFGNELLTSNANVPLKFEAAVAGAIPIIQAIQDSLICNDFQQVVGIINGTCNYILTAMEELDQPFATALNNAQELGYAEADPTFDIEGVDAAHKLTILAGLAFDTPFELDHVYVEGITKITAQDIEYAAELGYRIKHVGIAKLAGDGVDKGVEARVHPALIPSNALLANVNDVANAVVVRSDAAGQTLFSGPGAGGMATASSVLGDVVALARSEARVSSDSRTKTRYIDIGEVVCSNYLRIPVRDEPGVFAQVANTMSEHDISIEAAIQKEPIEGSAFVDIVIVTHAITESVMERAVATLREKLGEREASQGDISRIRIETLD